MKRLIPLAFLLVPLPSTVSTAQTPTVADGDEFQVNTYTTGDQISPRVAGDGKGDFIVVWTSDGATDDTDRGSVQAQRYGSSGDPLGEPFTVNTYTTGFQGSPDVAADGDGNFVVVWTSDGSEGGSDPGISVRGQRFAADGSRVGAPFQINTYTTESQELTKIAMHPDGRFVVAWESDGGNIDSAGWSVQAQRFGSSGDPIGESFLVNTFTSGDQLDPSVAMDGAGSFIIVWESSQADNGDNTDLSIQGQRFSSSGDPIGGQFLVNTDTAGNQEQADVAMDEAGNFVVVWRSQLSAGDASGESVHGRRFGSDGVARGAQFQINTYTLGDQLEPAVAVDPAGDFVVTWTSQISPGDDLSGDSIQARRSTSDGTFVGGQFQVNTFTTLSQEVPAVAATREGDFVVFWESNTSASDLDYSIQGQRFRVTSDLGDRVFLDADFDGLQDLGEPGIPGIAVHLFESLGDLVASTTTDAEGTFSFRPKIALAGVADRFYLQFDAPIRYSFSPAKVGPDDTIDSDVDPVFGQTDNIQIASAGETLFDFDAGMANGIGDRVWHDADGNGIQNGGEPGREGVTVELYDDSDMLLDTTVTASGGKYSFADLDAGTYYLLFVAPAGYAFTSPNQGLDEDADSDAIASGVTPLIALNAGDIRKDIDAGLEPAVIGNRVWLDEDGDGLQLPSDAGVPGVTVRLLDEGDLEVTSTVTDSNGLYGFSGVPSGSYRVEVVPTADGVFSAQDVGNDDRIDSDVDAAGRTALFAYTAGTASRTHDAGLRLLPLFADGFESGDTSMW